ncbi:MAG: glycosyltransferase [Patescibacteria group bacterium]|nr:glycosyltransferase [Patescibacteria group bacterium]
MKIGFFANTYLPVTYGTVTSIRNFRSGLEELGHEVHVITPQFGGYKDEKTNVYRWPSFMFGYKIKYPVAFPFNFKIRKYVQDIGFDVIHCQQPFPIAAKGLKVGHDLGIPVVFTHHCRYEDYVHYFPPIIPRGLLRWYVKKKATNFANSCDYVIVPSVSIKDMIEKRGVKKPIDVVPTGIEWDRFQSGNRGGVRGKHKITDDEVLLMSNGRFDQEKNIHFLVRALFPFLKENKKIKWMHVGDGSLKEEILTRAKVKGIERQFIITGVLPQDQMQHYYAAGDLFVHSSLTETQGMSLLEALVVGMPTVAIRATGTVDQIEHNKNGLLVEGDEEEFLGGVKKLLGDPELRKRIGDAALEYGKTCDYRCSAKRAEEIYQKVQEGFRK